MVLLPCNATMCPAVWPGIAPATPGHRPTTLSRRITLLLPCSYVEWLKMNQSTAEIQQVHTAVAAGSTCGCSNCRCTLLPLLASAARLCCVKEPPCPSAALRCAVLVCTAARRTADLLPPSSPPHLAFLPLPCLQRKIRFLNAQSAVDSGICECPRCCGACVSVQRCGTAAAQPCHGQDGGGRVAWQAGAGFAACAAALSETWLPSVTLPVSR
jgi:hypothetical protein